MTGHLSDLALDELLEYLTPPAARGEAEAHLKDCESCQATLAQMRAEREKRAVVLASEGERDAKINAAEGDKQRVIKASEANKLQQINEAEGQASAILAVATATAEGLRRVGGALSERGGIEAMQLRIGEEYVRQFGKLAKESTTLVVPGDLSDLASVVTMATSIIRRQPPA